MTSTTTSPAAPDLSGPPPPEGILRHLGCQGCVLLPLTADAAGLAAEIERLPEEVWVTRDRDPVVQASVDSFFAIGQPRGPRPLPPDDRPVLAHLPLLRRLLRQTIPASPTRAIVARLRPQGLIPIHRDTPRFFRGTVRVSIQLAADGPQRLFCDGRWYTMRPGEIWALDNLQPHGIYNDGARPRLNVLVDYEPAGALLELIAAGDAGLGAEDEAAHAEIWRRTRERYRRNRWRSLRYEIFKLLWRRG